jgi:hypothetical protein
MSRFAFAAKARSLCLTTGLMVSYVSPGRESVYVRSGQELKTAAFLPRGDSSRRAVKRHCLQARSQCGSRAVPPCSRRGRERPQLAQSTSPAKDCFLALHARSQGQSRRAATRKPDDKLAARSLSGGAHEDGRRRSALMDQ